MTDDAWFGITPEPVAKYIHTSSLRIIPRSILTNFSKIAEHVAQFAPANKTILIDAFSGAGGSTIAFANSNRWSQIIAMDNEPQVMECAKNNAKIYETKSPIMWVLGDVYEDLPSLPENARKAAVVFASPPWGGKSSRVRYDLVGRVNAEPYLSRTRIQYGFGLQSHDHAALLDQADL